jgi:small-conductance mechanosensitive channel
MNALLNDPFIFRVIGTALVLLAAAGARFLAVRRIRSGSHIIEDRQRRQLFYLRTVLTIAVLIGLLLIWAGALQNLLLSLTAVMVAVVIATKELLMCLSGFLLRTTGRLFSVGDWIECNGLRGEVTDHMLLSTALLELEPPENGYGYTGRTLNLPNSMFLVHPVHVSPFARRYVVHRFVITLAELNVDANTALKWLQARTERACEPFLEDARKVNESVDRKLGVDVEGPEPFVVAGSSDIGNLRFHVRIFCPREQAASVEREISGDFLSAVHNGRIGDAG